MAVVELKGNNFKKEVLESDACVLVDFYAEWCGPCKMTAPVVEELSEEMKDVVFGKVNVDEEQQLAGEYSIFSIPTFLVFKKGKVVHQFSGAKSKSSLKDEVEVAKDK